MIAQLIKNASSYGMDIDNLFTLIFVMVGFWWLLAEGVLIGLVLKFRRKDGQKAMYITGERHHEKRWIEYPHYAVILCDVVLIAGTVMVWQNVKVAQPPAEETVRIIAQQWAWTFVHTGPDGKLDTPDDVVTVDELHLKVNKVYHYELESKDVLHSFSIPSFRLKQDAIPGRTIKGWFKAIETGDYDLQCAEICGIGHGIMPALVKVETDEVYQQWLGGTHI